MPQVTKIPASIQPTRRKGDGGLNHKIKVAAYARVSTDKDEQLSSYAAQVDYYDKYIKSRPDWQFVKVYSEMKIANLIQFESLNTQEIGRNKGLLTYSTMSEAFIFLQSSMRKKIRGFKC